MKNTWQVLKKKIATQQSTLLRKKKRRWNPCINSNKYELERHDHEKRHL